MINFPFIAMAPYCPRTIRPKVKCNGNMTRETTIGKNNGHTS